MKREMGRGIARRCLATGFATQALELILQLSKRTQYGVRATVQLALAHQSTTYLQSKDLADKEHLPAKFLEQVLLLLRRGGVLESKVGSGGGYRLSVPPEQITVGQLLDILEPRGQDDPKPADDDAPGRLVLDRITSRLNDAQAAQVSNWTLAAVMDELGLVN